MSDVKIAGCHECPLFSGEWFKCRHPEAAAVSAENGTVNAQRETDLLSASQGFDADGREVLRAPAWCPLRQGVLTIALRTKGESKVRR